MASNEIDVFIVAEDPPLINFFAFEMWLDGLTAKEASCAITNAIAVEEKCNISQTSSNVSCKRIAKLNSLTTIKQFLKKSASKKDNLLVSPNSFQNLAASTRNVQNKAYAARALLTIKNSFFNSFFRSNYEKKNEQLYSRSKNYLQIIGKGENKVENFLKKEIDESHEKKAKDLMRDEDMKMEDKCIKNYKVMHNGNANDEFSNDTNNINFNAMEEYYSCMTKNIVEFLCSDIIQQFHMFDLLHGFLKNPEGFLTFSTLQIRLRERRLLIRKYYAIDGIVMKEILKQKKPLTIKQRSIRNIAKIAEVRISRVQTQIDNLRRIWRLVTCVMPKPPEISNARNFTFLEEEEEDVKEEEEEEEDVKEEEDEEEGVGTEKEELEKKKKEIEIDFSRGRVLFEEKQGNVYSSCINKKLEKNFKAEKEVKKEILTENTKSDSNKDEFSDMLSNYDICIQKEEKNTAAKPEINTSRNDNREVASLCRIFTPELAMRYFRICWLLQHKMELFTKRTIALNYNAVDRCTELFMNILHIKTLEIPPEYIDFSKMLKEMCKHAKQQEEIRQRISLVIGVPIDGGLMQGTLFGRNAEAIKINHKLKYFFQLIFSLSSNREFSKFFVYLVELIDKSFLTNQFFEACDTAFKENLTGCSVSLITFVSSICCFLKSVCTEMNNDVFSIGLLGNTGDSSI